MKATIITKLSLALALIFMIAIGAMSFKKAEKMDAKAATVYEYNSSSTVEGEFAKPANWVVATGTPSCGTSGDRPCRISVPDGSNLAAQIGGKSNAEVLNLPQMKRKP